MLSVAACCFGHVSVFGPATIVLLAYMITTDKSLAGNWIGQAIPALITASAVWFGIQQHDGQKGQVAYWAHRQTINCRNADSWEAMGKMSTYPKPTEETLRRCSSQDDASDFRKALEERGW